MHNFIKKLFVILICLLLSNSVFASWWLGICWLPKTNEKLFLRDLQIGDQTHEAPFPPLGQGCIAFGRVRPTPPDAINLSFLTGLGEGAFAGHCELRPGGMLGEEPGFVWNIANSPFECKAFTKIGVFELPDDKGVLHKMRYTILVIKQF